MSTENQREALVNRTRAEHSADFTTASISPSFQEYLNRVRDFGNPTHGAMPAPIDLETNVSTLRAGVVFGDFLKHISRIELVKLAERGDEEARTALTEIFGSKAIYPGTFDPLTLGHADVVRRAVKLFGHVVIAVGINPGKSPLFSIDERLALIKEEFKDLGERVQVLSFEKSLVNFARRLGCQIVLRGIRSVTDYEQELQLALVNQSLSKGEIETLFIPAKEGSSFVSSSIVKAVVKLDEDASSMVSANILNALQRKKAEGKL